MRSGGRVLAVVALLNSSALAQQYVISTYAGGGPPPTPIAATKLAIAPMGMATDPSGNLYFISDNCVFKLDQTGTVTRIAGNSRPGYSGDGGPALTAQFHFASAIAVGGGNVYVADLERVRRITPDGIIKSIAGTDVRGYSGDGGPAAAAQVNSAYGMTTDSTGNVFFVDGSRVRKISSSGIITAVAGNGSYGFSGDGGPATKAQIQPFAVAVDGRGNLYIADDGNLRIRKVSADGIITTVAGTGTWGMSGDGGPATAAQLTGASGVVLDSTGSLYISDSSPSSDDYDCSCVRKISPDGNITTLGGLGLFRPRALAVDHADNLYIADTGNGLIRRVNSAGTMSIAAGNGAHLFFSGDGGPAAGAQLCWPMGVAIDGQGNVYIGDTFNNRVRAVSLAGIITTLAGNGIGNYSGDGAAAADAGVYIPVGIAVDSGGNVYIADHGNSRIRKVSKTGIITTAVDPADIPTLFGGSQVWGLAVDKHDNLYVPDPTNNRILKITTDGVVTTVAGNGTHGYSGDGGPATSAQIRLTAKTALATDGEGSLYFSDDDVQAPPPGVMPSGTLSSPRIRKVSPDGTITTVAGNGTSGYSGDGGPATKAQLGSQLNYPVALAGDNAGNLYIADGDNSRIRMVSTGGIITTIAGTGTQGYSGDGGPATSAQLGAPSGVAIDSAGNLFVADQFNNVVRLLQPVSSTTSITAVTNAASGLPGPISPGEIVVLSGSALGPGQLVSGAADHDGRYSTQLAGTTVRFDGTLAPLVYTWATQGAVVVPYSTVGGSAQITITYQDRVSAPVSVPVDASAPGVFTLDTTGKGQAAALNQDGLINSAANPARTGDVISLFATGAGETTPAGMDGSVTSVPPPHPILPVSVTIGGKAVTPVQTGGATGEIAGVLRIDVPVPSGIQTGPAVPVTVQIGNNSSQPGVTIAVQ